jgi:hypothetical protein
MAHVPGGDYTNTSNISAAVTTDGGSSWTAVALSSNAAVEGSSNVFVCGSCAGGGGELNVDVRLAAPGVTLSGLALHWT